MKKFDNTLSCTNDFSVDTEFEERSGLLYKKYFFRVHEKLIGYIYVCLPKKQDNQIYPLIVDTTSGSGYKYMTKEMQDFYNKHGFDQNYAPKGMGKKYYDYVLQDIKKHYNNEECIVSIGGYDTRIENIHTLINKTKQYHQGIIKKIIRGGDFALASLYI